MEHAARHDHDVVACERSRYAARKPTSHLRSRGVTDERSAYLSTGACGRQRSRAADFPDDHVQLAAGRQIFIARGRTLRVIETRPAAEPEGDPVLVVEEDGAGADTA
jgi:hypothetical protein